MSVIQQYITLRPGEEDRLPFLFLPGAVGPHKGRGDARGDLARAQLRPFPELRRAADDLPVFFGQFCSTIAFLREQEKHACGPFAARRRVLPPEG